MPQLVPGPASDVFPNGDDAFDAWAVNFELTTTLDALAVDQPIKPLPLGIEVAAYTVALAVASDPGTRTSVTVAAKDAAKAALELSCRLNAGFWQSQFKLGTITAATLDLFGLREAKVRAPIPQPVIAPVLQVTRMNVGSTRIEARDPGTPDHRALPYGVTNVETQLTFGLVSEAGALQSRSGFLLISDPSRVGQQATLRCRYATARALVGPWSDPVSYIVT